jgi:hypothetical protein
MLKYSASKMKLSLILMSLALILWTSFTANAQTGDTVHAQGAKSAPADTTNASSISTHERTEDDFSPGLVFFTLIGFGIAIAIAGVGIALTIVGLFIIFGLISFGVLSASVLVGLNKKSFTKGFKTFLVSYSSVCALLICSSGFWLLNKIYHWWTTVHAVSLGAFVGVLTGFTFGFLVFYTLRRVTTFLRKQLKLTTT